MLPTMPAGHSGCRLGPRRIGTSGRPSLPSARRAQLRAMVYSRTRFSTALATSGSSSGSSRASGSSPSTSAETTSAGSRSSITVVTLPFAPEDEGQYTEDEHGANDQQAVAAQLEQRDLRGRAVGGEQHDGHHTGGRAERGQQHLVQQPGH